MKKGRLSTIILILVFLVGLSLLLYPTVSDYWNSLHQSWAVADYAEAVENADSETNQQLLSEAIAYNQTLPKKNDRFVLTEEEQAEYEKLLKVSDTGVIARIEIPKIGCSLPVYHGTDESVLQIGVGHLEGSSLPVGGEGTHAVISGHRGLPSATLFTDLDKLEIGDTFTIQVLEETLCYEVDQILVVEPYEVSALDIEAGKDYCTLVTCTPYGINSQRLLVRGHRVALTEQTAPTHALKDTKRLEPALIAPLIIAPILLLLVVLLIRAHGRKK